MNSPADKNCPPLEAWKEFVRSGDLKSLEIVYHHYFEVFIQYGKRLCPEIQMVEDGIQNVFVRLMNSRRKLSGIENFHSYLMACFRNEILYLVKRNKKFHRVENYMEFSFWSEDSVSAELFGNENDQQINGLIRESIKKLTPSQREMIFLRFYAELSYQDISNVLGISIESCRTSVFRAISKLKEELETLKGKGLHL